MLDVLSLAGLMVDVTLPIERLPLEAGQHQMARGMFVEHVMPHSAGVAANRTRLCPIWRILTRCDFMEIDCNRMTTHTQHVITCIRSPMMRE